MEQSKYDAQAARKPLEIIVLNVVQVLPSVRALMSQNKLIIIINPKSGDGDDNFRADVEKAFKENGANHEIRETKPDLSGEELAQQAMKEGARDIVACGGDGTIMSVVNGIAKTQTESGNDDCTLSIVPGGTANLVATALQIPIDIKESVACAAGKKSEERTIDLGRCEKYYFVLGVGVGLTERVISKTSSKEKEALGKLAYVKSMLGDIGARPHSIKFKLDERSSKRARGVAIVIANAGTIGGKLDFAPRARMDDGVLDLCILHSFGARDLVRIIWHSLTGKLEKERSVSFYQAKRIEIETDPPQRVQVDGELEEDLKLPLFAEVVPKALRVRVLQGWDDKEKPATKE